MLKTGSAQQIRPRSLLNRPVGRLVLLALLFVASSAYFTRVVMYREPRWFGWHPVSRPFFVGEMAAFGPDVYPRISFLISAPREAGLKEDDALLQVNGRKVTGAAVLGEALRKSKDGDTMTVKFARLAPRQNGSNAKTQPEERTASFQLTTQESGRWLDYLSQDTLLIFLPVLAVLMGFWIAALRPQDPLGWLVMALMLTYVAFGDPNAMTWPRYLRDLCVLFRAACNSLFAIWLLLFGIYFPEPLPASSPHARWLKLKWIFIFPLAAFAIIHMASSVAFLEDLALARWLARLPAGFNIMDVCLMYSSEGLAITLIASKYRAAVSADAKRRLRLLAVGAAITLAPFFLEQAVAIIRGVNPELAFPKVVWFGVDVLFFLFPIVLAYVIVVHRAMDVRFVVRQGLQYALAKNGVRVIQFIITAIALLAAVRLISNSGSNSWLKLLIIGGGLGLIPLIQSGADRLRHWVDTRFFREAYNAENVLNELSDQVRTMVQPQSLLETVVTRISETLHVAKIAVLLDSGSPFRPVYALGYGHMPQLQFAPGSGSVKLLKAENEPLRVYPDDENSWLYREKDVTDEEREELVRLSAELLLPLSSRDKLLGFISLGPKRSEEPFTGSDLRLLKSVATQTGLALENAQLVAAITEEITKRERLNREVEIAREVQERLFPQELPAISGLDYFGACRPALGVGGDYYDFLALPEGQLGIAVGDVSGKGIGAALLMASLQASLRSEAARALEDIAPIVTNVNRLVYQASTSNRYATFFYAQYDPARHVLTYVNAGHNPPMLFRRQGGDWQVLRLEAGGTVVGLLESFPYEQEKLSILPGDLLIIFTDGISEAMNLADEEWGEDRFTEAVKACSQLAAHEILDQLMRDADCFADGAKQHDDMTLVVIKVA